MRRRMLTSILLFALIVSSLIAASKDSFTISAYKIPDEVGTERIYLFVFDSIYDSFAWGGDDDIDIADKLNSLFGDVDRPREITFNSDTMVFHVGAIGQGSGNFQMDIYFDPLSRVADETSSADVTIPAAYTLGNVRGNFENSSDTSANGNKLTLGEMKSFTGAVSSGSVGTLSQKWNVAGSSSTDRWILRAAVAMTIDKDSFDTIPPGDYSAAVNITCTVI